MKKYFCHISYILALVISLNVIIPVSNAYDVSYRNSALSEVVNVANYSIRGFESDQIRYNIMVDKKEGVGQFALVYLNSPNYVYEYFFKFDDVDREASGNSSGIQWDAIRDHCFENKNVWKKTNISSAVIVVHEADKKITAHDIVKTRSADTTYFENWLINEYGNEYSGNLITTKTKNGIKMYLNWIMPGRRCGSMIDVIRKL